MAREVVFIDWCDYCTFAESKAEATDRLVVSLDQGKVKLVMACPEHVSNLSLLRSVYDAAMPLDDQPAPGSRRSPEKAAQPVLEASAHDRREFECLLCEYRTHGTTSALTQHYKMKHGVLPRDAGPDCPVCGAPMGSAQGLGGHLRTHADTRGAQGVFSVLPQLLRGPDPHGYAHAALQRLTAAAEAAGASL